MPFSPVDIKYEHRVKIDYDLWKCVLLPSYAQSLAQLKGGAKKYKQSSIKTSPVHANFQTVEIFSCDLIKFVTLSQNIR